MILDTLSMSRSFVTFTVPLWADLVTLMIFMFGVMTDNSKFHLSIKIKKNSISSLNIYSKALYVIVFCKKHQTIWLTFLAIRVKNNNFLAQYVTSKCWLCSSGWGGPGHADHRVPGGAQHAGRQRGAPTERGRPGVLHQRPRRLTTHAWTGMLAGHTGWQNTNQYLFDQLIQDWRLMFKRKPCQKSNLKWLHF